MLRKLMKHEFRATGRVMGPLFGLLLIAAIAARFSVGVLLESSARFLNLLGGLFTTAFVIAIVGVCVMSLVLMIIVLLCMSFTSSFDEDEMEGVS